MHEATQQQAQSYEEVRSCFAWNSKLCNPLAAAVQCALSIPAPLTSSPWTYIGEGRGGMLEVCRLLDFLQSTSMTVTCDVVVSCHRCHTSITRS